ncbi:lipoprotein insertase outer membrane protein LolB [Pseudoduganella ginsengisoli]|uniref:Outer-membrane lipoprotein LolB n=1 Tax=Pseudoduganella ginsengisoli TaxID=1462440 RepID=A0A6L6Q2T4_9BURK|nr:outer membrane lipoprotein LolB [Pseudoduganella ginsengisoli]MTW03724.1 outer membrane lipoprotein LolB [Pseudoduganella ginsengisoli]
MHKLIPLLLAAALAGCASAPERPAGAPPSGPVAPYTDTIELAGKINVAYTKDGNQEHLIGRFEWRQSAQRTDVTILSPLGQTVAYITVTPQQATLQEGSKPLRTAENIDALSAQALGWTLPVSGMREWLQGYATAAHGKHFRASPQDTTVTTADGWRLNYVSWHDASAAGEPGAPKPKRIDAERGATGQIDAMTIQVVLDAPAQ